MSGKDCSPSHQSSQPLIGSSNTSTPTPPPTLRKTCNFSDSLISAATSEGPPKSPKTSKITPLSQPNFIFDSVTTESSNNTWGGLPMNIPSTTTTNNNTYHANYNSKVVDKFVYSNANSRCSAPLSIPAVTTSSDNLVPTPSQPSSTNSTTDTTLSTVNSSANWWFFSKNTQRKKQVRFL